MFIDNIDDAKYGLGVEAADIVLIFQASNTK
jgi:hypothetical protein